MSPTSINTNVSPDHWHNINTARLTSLRQHSSLLRSFVIALSMRQVHTDGTCGASTDFTSHISRRWKNSNWTNTRVAVYLEHTHPSSFPHLLGKSSRESWIWVPFKQPPGRLDCSGSSDRDLIVYNPWWSGRRMSYRICATVREDSIVLRATFASSDSYPRNNLGTKEEMLCQNFEY